MWLPLEMSRDAGFQVRIGGALSFHSLKTHIDSKQIGLPNPKDSGSSFPMDSVGLSFAEKNQVAPEEPVIRV